MSRLFPALLALVACAVLVAAALLPEYTVAGEVRLEIVPLDPNRPSFGASLVGILVQVGLLLGPALMIALRESRGVAAGVLLGAAGMGLSLRGVRLVQLAQTPGLDPAAGSGIDLLGESLALLAAILALFALRETVEDKEEHPPLSGEGA